MDDARDTDAESLNRRPQRPAPPPQQGRRRKRTAAEEVRETEFPIVLRGYDRHAVDNWREQVAKLIERLETSAPRDTAVRRALEEVGQETSSILQRAHESADEITSRSRAQAEGRLQRAEREAEITIREADSQAERLEVDAQQIWRDRQRLVEEIRQLADELLGVADDATERLGEPGKRTVRADDFLDTLRGVEGIGEVVDDEDDEREEYGAPAELPPAAEDDTRTLPTAGRSTSTGSRFSVVGSEASDDAQPEESDEDTIETSAPIEEPSERSSGPGTSSL